MRRTGEKLLILAQTTTLTAMVAEEVRLDPPDLSSLQQDWGAPVAS